MASISFIHLASAGKKISTGYIISNARKHHPNSYYFLASDAADNLKEIAKLNNCEYQYYDTKVGYPSYDLEKLLLWFERFKYACEQCNTTHIIMMEDDVWITKPITVSDDWELAGQNVTVGNIIPKSIIDSIIDFSGKTPKKNQYGFGGGSIFKVSTFLENYDRVIKWFKINHNEFRKDYMPLGFMDCYMMVFYLLCGKDVSVNPFLTDTHHHQNNGYDYDKFVNEQEYMIEIVNNYKKYYWV